MSEDTIGSKTAGGSSLTTPVSIANGGTGQATASAAFEALSPLTTKGDLLTHSATVDTRLPVGADGFVLTADSAQALGVKWAAAGASGANTALSNLAATAVNADIIPDADASYELGATALRWSQTWTESVQGIESIVGQTGAELEVYSDDIMYIGSTTAGIVQLYPYSGAAGEFQFADDDGSHTVGFKSPAALSVNTTYTWPSADGSSGQALTTNGSGILSWSGVANRALSNLSAVAIAGSDLLPAAPFGTAVGSESFPMSGFDGNYLGIVDTPSVSRVLLISSNDSGGQTVGPLTNVNASIRAIFGTEGFDLAIVQDDDSAADAATAGGVVIKAGDKTAGTGDGGSIYLQPGSSAGGVGGRIGLSGYLFQDNSSPSFWWGSGIPGLLFDLGTPGVETAVVFGSADSADAGTQTPDAVFNSGALTDAGSTLPTGFVYIRSGDNNGSAATAHTSDVSIESGNSVGGNSGSIQLNVGTAGLVRGSVNFNAPRSNVGGFLHFFNSTSDPAGGTKGDAYFNSTSNKLKIYNGTTWETVTSI